MYQSSIIHSQRTTLRAITGASCISESYFHVSLCCLFPVARHTYTANARVESKFTFHHLKARFLHSCHYSTILLPLSSAVLELSGLPCWELTMRQISHSFPVSLYMAIALFLSSPPLTAPPSQRQSNNVLLIDQRKDECNVEVNGCLRE